MSQLSLYKFFQRDSALLKPCGPLSKVIPSSCIEAANKTVKDIVSLESTVSMSDHSCEASTKKERGSYEQFTPEEKLQMGKRAAERGMASTIRYFQKLFSDRAVKESSVRTWRNKYLKRLPKESMLVRKQQILNSSLKRSTASFR